MFHGQLGYNKRGGERDGWDDGSIDPSDIRRFHRLSFPAPYPPIIFSSFESFSHSLESPPSPSPHFVTVRLTREILWKRREFLLGKEEFSVERNSRRGKPRWKLEILPVILGVFSSKFKILLREIKITRSFRRFFSRLGRIFDSFSRQTFSTQLKVVFQIKISNLCFYFFHVS